MSVKRLKSLVHRLFDKQLVQADIKEKCGLPSQRACNAENASMLWDHCEFSPHPHPPADDKFEYNFVN